MKKLMAVAGACLLAACSGQTVTGPDPVVVTEDAAPVAKATPAPQPVAGTPAAGSAFKLTGAKGVIYVEYAGSARTSVETYYTSFDNQSLKFAVQTHNVEPNSTLTRSFPVTTCFQGDAEQVGVKPIGGIFFDKNGNPFNPTKEPQKVEECRTPAPRPTPSPEPSPSPSPSPSPTPEPTCTDLNPQPGAVTKSIENVTTKHPGTPGTPAVTKTFYWYDAEQGNDGPNIQNDCEAEGGTYYHQIKIPTGGNEEDVNVCKTPVNHGSSWEYDNNDYASREAAVVETITPAIPGTPDKYSVTVTLTYSIAAGAAQSRTFKIVYDPTDFVKKQVTVQVGCGQAKSGTLVWGQGDQYNSSPNYTPGDGHVTGNYVAVVQ